MAWEANIGSAGNGGTGTGSTLVITLTDVCPVGKTVILAAIQTLGIVSSVADSRGNTWVVDETKSQGATVGVSLCSCQPSVALQVGDTITVTYNGVRSGRVAVAMRYDALLVGSFHDSAGDGNSSATTGSSPASITGGSTTQARDIVVAAVGTGITAPTMTPASGLGAALYTGATSGTIRGLTVADKTVLATGAQTGSFTFASTIDWAGVIATYKVAPNQTQSVPAIANTGATYAPTIRANYVAPDAIASPAAIYAPTARLNYVAPNAIASPAATYKPTIARSDAPIDFAEDFEAVSLDGYTITGSPTLTTSSPIAGAQSLRINSAPGAGATFIAQTPLSGHRVGAFRFQYRHLADPAVGAASLHAVTVDGAIIAQIRVSTAGVLQALFTGGTTQNGPSVEIGDTLRFDLEVDTSTTAYTLRWSVNDVPQTTATLDASANGAADFNKYRLGQINAGTCDFLLDDWAYGYTPGLYPIGAGDGSADASPHTITQGTRPDTHATYRPTVTAQPQDLEWDERFELATALNAYNKTGAVTIGDNDGGLEALKVARFNGHGVMSLSKDVVTSETVCVTRFLFRLEANATGGAATCFDVRTAAGISGQIRVQQSGLIQALMTGGSSFSGITLSPGIPYLIEARFDCSGAGHTLEWKIDGVGQPTASLAVGAASTLSKVRLGQLNGTPTFNFTADAWAVSYNPAAYPIGDPAAVVATDTLEPAFIDAPHRRSESGGFTRGMAWRIGSNVDGDLASGVPSSVDQDVEIVSLMYFWSDVEAVRGTFDWNRIRDSILFYKATDRKGILRVMQGTHAPAHVYTSAGGNVPFLDMYGSAAQTTKNQRLPLYWDASWRTETNRLAHAIKDLLDTPLADGSGEHYRDYIINVPIGVGGEDGTEMSLQYSGDVPRNKPLWDAVTPLNGFATPEKSRQSLMKGVWSTAIDDWLSIITNTSLSIALGGMFNDGEAGSAYLAAHKFPHPRLVAMYTNFAPNDDNGVKGSQTITGPWSERQVAAAANLITVRKHAGRLGMQSASWTGGPNQYVDFADPYAAMRYAMDDLTTNWPDVEYYEHGSTTPFKDAPTLAAIHDANLLMEAYASDPTPGPFIHYGEPGELNPAYIPRDAFTFQPDAGGTGSGGVDTSGVGVIGFKSRPGFSFGGGFSTASIFDPREEGTMILGGDLYGIYEGVNYGEWFEPRMRQLPTSNGGTQGIYVRALCAASEKHPNRIYHLSGTLKGGPGSGWFGYTTGLTDPLHKSPAAYGGGTAQGASAAAERPRACGQLIVVDYDEATDTEYIYALMSKNTVASVLARSTDGGETWTELWAGGVNQSAWKTLELVDGNNDGVKDTLLFGTYRDTTTDDTSATGSIVRRMVAGSQSIRTATLTTQVTVTTIGTLPGVVEKIKLAQDGTGLMAACGPYGVYTATVRTGATWSKQSGSFFDSPHLWVGSIDGASTSHMVVGLSGKAGLPEPEGNAVALYTSGAWAYITTNVLTHSPINGQIRSYNWGDDDHEDWLMQPGPSFTNWLGGSTFDVQDIQMSTYDTDIIAVCGSAGAWVTKNSGGYWRGAKRGYCGGVSKGVKAGANGSVIFYDLDYGSPDGSSKGSAKHVDSTDHLLATAKRTNTTPPAYLTGQRILIDAAGYTYQLVFGTATTPTKLLRTAPAALGGDTTDIADDRLKAGLISFEAWDMSPDGYIYISQYGGGMLVVDPVIGHIHIPTGLEPGVLTGGSIFRPLLHGGGTGPTLSPGAAPSRAATYGPRPVLPIQPDPVLHPGFPASLAAVYQPIVTEKVPPDAQVIVDCYTGSVTVSLSTGQGMA